MRIAFFALLASPRVAAQGVVTSVNPCTARDQQPRLFHDLRHIGKQGPRQDVAGPVQDNEALLLFALVRVLGVNRVLEIGGLSGHSARVFSAALNCMPRAKVYTIDLLKVPSVAANHHTLQKNAANLTAADVDHEPIDLLFLDCHNYDASVALVKSILRQNLLSPTALVVLHDTGMSELGFLRERFPGFARSIGPDDPRLMPPNQQGKRFFIHQPVERMVSVWLTRYDCTGNWQTLAAHDDAQKGATPNRWGLTIMQRKVDLSVPAAVCNRNLVGPGGVNPKDKRVCEELATPGGTQCRSPA